MPLEILTGPDVPSLLQRAQGALGPDAVVVSVRRVSTAGRLGFEMVAADPVTAASIQRAERQTAAPPPAAKELWTNPLAAPERPVRSTPVPKRAPAPARRPDAQAGDAAELLWGAAPEPPKPRASRWPWARRDRARRGQPLVIALVGPTGAGKTTTLAKLATNAIAFGGRRVGLLCLDTYRVGGVEQLRQYAELARLPFEVAHDANDASRARRRLGDVDVVLVDTAGRGPAAHADHAATHEQLLALAPDETHIVMPAGLQTPMARTVATRHLRFGATHLLVTKLDEYPAEKVAFEIASAFALPMRWIADGQEVPGDLQRAPAGGAAAFTPRATEAV